MEKPSHTTSWMGLLLGVICSWSGGIAWQDGVAAKSTDASVAIADWRNGQYQLCSEPDPRDWRDGAGVCVVFSKTNRQLNGYYGYPHSDRFICIRGSLQENRFQGEALALTWFASPKPNLSSLEKQWDTEGRMQVAKAHISQLEAVEEGWVAWVHFDSATLDLKGLHRYATAKMRPGSDLCDWSL